MKLYFVTGNKNKHDEAKAIIPELLQLDIDLPEIQEMNSQKIIESKLQAIKGLLDSESLSILKAGEAGSAIRSPFVVICSNYTHLLVGMLTWDCREITHNL